MSVQSMYQSKRMSAADAVQFVRHSDFFLFNDFIVADNVQFYVRCYYRYAVDFFVAEKLVGDFDNAFFP